jgi:hypothetical protein
MTSRPESPDEATRLFETALAAIDAANADDPHTLEVRGERRPKELAHAELVTEWVRRLRPDASEALRLAARAHHVRRWEISREGYAQDRAGYLRWRKDLQELHAKITAGILRQAGYAERVVKRVEDILWKRGLGRDAEVQAFEDALCLTFLETQLTAFAGQTPEARARTVLAKTVDRMSAQARRLALDLSLPDNARALIVESLES